MMTMTTCLADSSAWIDFIRQPSSALRDFVEDNSAGHTEAVAMELLSGTSSARDSLEVERLLLRSPLLSFDITSDFTAATQLRRTALRRRLRVGIVDCMILAVAARHGVPLLTRDRAQAELATSVGLRAELIGS